MAKARATEEIKKGEHLIIPVGVKLFVCVDHDGKHGTESHRASVVLARDENHARELLDKALIKIGLVPFARKRYRLQPIELDKWTAEVLADGSL